MIKTTYGGGGGLEVVFMVNKYMNLRKSKKFKNYRVTHKGWDFTDDITEFFEAFFLLNASLILSASFFLYQLLFSIPIKGYIIYKENWIEGGGVRVSVHFAVTFLDWWRTSFCVTTKIKIVNNNTNDKQTSGISGVFIGGGRITLNLIKNVVVIRLFSYKTKSLNFFNIF